mgnify:CR=1 FL=1
MFFEGGPRGIRLGRRGSLRLGQRLRREHDVPAHGGHAVREERAQLICDQHRTKGLLLWLDVPGRWENAATRKQFWYSGHVGFLQSTVSD